MVYFGLGSNLGDRENYLQKAVGALDRVIGVEALSSIYETEPWGVKGQPEFLNMVAGCRTDRPLDGLLYIALEIENELGRVRDNRWQPRSIDIDIILADGEIVQTPELTVPHYLLAQRKFALLPLAEIAPEKVHPSLGKTIKRLLEECPDNSRVELFKRHLLTYD